MVPSSKESCIKGHLTWSFSTSWHDPLCEEYLRSFNVFFVFVLNKLLKSKQKNPKNTSRSADDAMTLMWRNSNATTWFQGSFSAPLTYQSFAGDRIFNIDDVYKVVQLATTCEYSLTVECNEVDTDDVWLVPYNTTVPFVPYDEMMGTFCISEDNGQFVYHTVNFNLIFSRKNLFAFSIIFGIAKIVGTLGCGRQGPALPIQSGGARK